MILTEALVMDASTRRRTTDGYLLANAAPAKVGIQEYAASDFGMGGGVIKLYRPVEEVFDKDSISSYVAKPVTDDHPQSFVTSRDWKDKAKGFVGNEVMRDGEKIMIPIMVADEGLIGKIEAGKAELSAGYTAKIEWKAGLTDKGEAYDGIMREIRINHVAVVDRGRAGHECRVLDKQEVKMTKSTLIDGIPVTLDETAYAAVNKLQDKIAGLEASLKDAGLKASKEAGEAAAKAKALEDKVASLEKQVNDAGANLDSLIEDRMNVIAVAKEAIADFSPNGKSTADIKRMVVDMKLGDAAKGKDAAFIDAAYLTLSAVKAEDKKPLSGHSGKVEAKSTTAVSDAYDEYIATLTRKGNSK